MTVNDSSFRSDKSTPEKAGESDKARATEPHDGTSEAKSPPKLTPLRRQMALERIAKPSAPESEIIRRAGGSKWTARCPKRNGLDSQRFAEQVARIDGVSAAKAKKIGLSTLATLAQDEGQPGGTRGASAKALVDFAVAAADSDTEGTTRADLERQAQAIRRLVLACMQCAKDRPATAQRILERLQRQVANEPEIEAEPHAAGSGRRWEPGGSRE